jgi:hypothetical protein
MAQSRFVASTEFGSGCLNFDLLGRLLRVGGLGKVQRQNTVFEVRLNLAGINTVRRQID